MTPDSDFPVDAPPAARIAAAVELLGEDEVVTKSVALLAGFNVGEDFLLYVGGVHAQGILDGAPPLYWPEVWGARALLYVWNDTALDAVKAGLTNQAWRVREMSTRVTAARELPYGEFLRPLLTDEVARVRAAAARALGEVGEPSDADLLATLFRDPEIDVRRAADQATKRLTARA
jgi:HEAT repeat protein